MTFTGRPASRDSSAASTAKSGFDLRPKPPPSRVTCTVTASGSMPRARAISPRALCGDWVGAQTSQRPSRKSAVAQGGSMGDCDRWGV